MKTKALFPGSFDPFTAGHLNILKRALTMFDEVVVAVGINQDKRGFLTSRSTPATSWASTTSSAACGT